MAKVPYHEVGADMNLRRAMANAPGGAEALASLVSWLRTGSKLDKRLCELAILQVAALTGSTYEWIQHVELARKIGVPDADIHAVDEHADEDAGDGARLDPLARTVLRGAREMCVDGAMSGATFDELHAALGTEPVIELVIAIGFYNGMARTLRTLEIDVEPRLQPLLEEFPLPQNRGQTPVS